MQRIHRRGSQAPSECCKVGYSATLARAHVHNFICSESRVFLRWGTYAERSFERIIHNA